MLGFPPPPFGLNPHQEPDAWKWIPGSQTNPPKPPPNLGVPTFAEIQKVCDPEIQRHPFPKSKSELDAQLEELRYLARLLDDAGKVSSTSTTSPRKPISIFLQRRPQPIGAVHDELRAETAPVILTGRELARWFEKDTPNLAFSHALNYLIVKENPTLKWSPPRQAQVWTALNLAIYTALLAAWHYKWNEPTTKFKPRPAEVNKTIPVLYDFKLDGSPVTTPPTFPGTPRHPSYPSGHSAVAGAACELLSLYFVTYRSEFDNLADNAGLARMWAGIHYRADHEFGVAIGRAIGKLIYARVNP